jgi:pimeloyl-ACP methyl ester carboxylesterase
MPNAIINGQSIYFEDTGGTGQPLIFSHGLLMDHSMFASQVQALSSRYRCISWDERGHGLTQDATEPFSYYDSANDLAALLDHLGIKQAVLVGMSQGGYLSLRAALLHPQIVRALVLIDTQAQPEDPAKLPGYMQMVTDWVQHGLSDETATIIEHIILGAGFIGAAEWKARWKNFRPNNLQQIFTTLGSRDDISNRLGEIQAPSLVIHGELDAAIEVARAQDMTRRLVHAELVVIPGAGHAANLTHAAAVNPHIERFLASLA